MIEITATYHTATRGRGCVLARKARSSWAEVAVFNARHLLVQGAFSPALRPIVAALRLSHNGYIICRVFSSLVLWLRIMGSQVKCRVKSNLDTPVYS